MAGGWVRKRVLIVVRTYPAPAKSVIEASCTAAIGADGKWVRMFPVPARLMEHDKRFAKWFWIEVDLLRASSDARPESHKIKPDSIVISDGVGTQGNWRARRDLIKPLQRPSMCHIQQKRDEHNFPTLGVFRPHEITGFTIEPTAENWTEAQLATLTQDTLFEKAPEKTLEKIPFDFRYQFRCGGRDCRGHDMMCTDWEMGQAYRKWRAEYGDQWEGKFREKFETQMIEKNDTHFFVGTVHKNPASWIIVGLFYPPKPPMNDLFDDASPSDDDIVL
jgi:hypothetical protein